MNGTIESKVKEQNKWRKSLHHTADINPFFSGVLRRYRLIDTENYEQVKALVEETISSGKIRLVIDLAGVSYINSAGWGIFIGNVKVARSAGGDIKLAGMQAEVENIYKLVEFNEILNSYKTIEEAKKFY